MEQIRDPAHKKDIGGNGNRTRPSEVILSSKW